MAKDSSELLENGPHRVTAKEVANYLATHPDFFLSHPDLVAKLTPPAEHDGESVVDFQHFLYERQRRELNRVNLEYRNLIAVSRGNLASQGRVHKAALTVLAAPSFGQLLQIVTTDLARLWSVKGKRAEARDLLAPIHIDIRDDHGRAGLQEGPRTGLSDARCATGD